MSIKSTLVCVVNVYYSINMYVLILTYLLTKY